MSAKEKPKPKPTQQKDLTYRGVEFQPPILEDTNEPTYALPFGTIRRPLKALADRESGLRLGFNVGTRERIALQWFTYDQIKALNGAAIDDAIAELRRPLAKIDLSLNWLTVLPLYTPNAGRVANVLSGKYPKYTEPTLTVVQVNRAYAAAELAVRGEAA